MISTNPSWDVLFSRLQTGICTLKKLHIDIQQPTYSIINNRIDISNNNNRYLSTFHLLNIRPFSEHIGSRPKGRVFVMRGMDGIMHLLITKRGASLSTCGLVYSVG